MPSFKVLAAALRRTTERLAREVAYPTGSEPEWNEIEWAIAQSAAAMQGISTLLANTLSWSGPAAWQEFLAEQREQSILRDARVGALLEHIDAAARKRGIDCVALKGAALRALDLYRPGERPMGDVDLLVADRDLKSIAAAMTDIDYVEAFAKQRHRVYEPRQKVAPRGFGEHVDNPLKIEVHTVIAEPLPVRSVDITERLKSGRARPGRQLLSRPRVAAAPPAAACGRQHARTRPTAGPTARYRDGRRPVRRARLARAARAAS